MVSINCFLHLLITEQILFIENVIFVMQGEDYIYFDKSDLTLDLLFS